MFDNNEIFNSAGQDAAKPIPKVVTHIRGLDEILEGGLPEGRLTVLNGGPGSGKTVLALEFAYRSALAGEPCLFVSFEERAEGLRRNALAMGWDLQPLEEANQLLLIDSRPAPDVIRVGAFDLTGLLAILGGKIAAMGARRLVIDSLDAILRIFADPDQQRDQLLKMVDWLNDKRFTSVLTARSVSQTEKFPQHRLLEYATDCLIRLDYRVLGQIATRRLRVVKYRGSGYGSNEYPCVIAKDGIFLLPVSTMGFRHTGLGEKMSSGHSEIDEILGGGFRRSSSVLISGSAGTGKTTLLSTFVQAACRRGEKVLSVNFEESLDAMLSGMRNVGIDLRPFLENGTLKTMTAMPESMGAEDHLFRLFTAMEHFQPDHVVVDAISATLRIGTPQAAFEYLMRLVIASRERGITTVMSNQVGSALEIEEISSLGISSLVDALIQLRYMNTGAEIKRVFLSIKSRGMAHSNRFHEFRITDHGIAIMGPCVFQQQHRISVPGKSNCNPGFIREPGRSEHDRVRQ